MSWIRCVFSIFFYTINTLIWFVPIFICGLIKLIPIKPLQKLMSWTAKQCASIWVTFNTLNQKLLTPTKLSVTGLEELKLKDWYLVIANHQSWVDILVLQRVFNRKIPFLNFFLKKELIYVPVLGLCWWALDFPFMTRTSKSQLKKNPKLRGKDLETTRKACEKFKEMPVSVVNFVEGTRFTAQKHSRQNSPFPHLLKPKAGGVAFVMQAMGEQISKVVNVTIQYPEGIPTFMDFASGRVKQINIHVEVMPVSQELIGDYTGDSEFRVRFQSELNRLWQEKEQQLSEFEQKLKS
ncbi:acyltransferase [Pseudoalteromonas sp. SR44-5]|mgnify:CR=1 FL=1|uniref:Acyltransferase n=2 Tax=Pseudoalteromonas TaxID=53246 RepID=A0ABW8L1F2_9GAMM|nr:MULTISPECIES: acyltransferase [unclassified Pseudoalteromonas]MBB1334923.1 acyltransferase [Pseudoalteromonas sp. SR41-6]MBB1368142.1 acyltransferase [Pseudoalteromonas sp. SR44-5]MBB1424605.1 acyltransferase [Pseudoalteromonas sp. SG43-7]MBB1459101.1 acyltransferase [Pseudoalteromonas sp. SG41-8]MBB1467518.1 acyltransferase [Pseudoalteromonas sp. SG41-5]|tara:strand:- start:276 stop:1157 length:882 start_codon:yes stop_codon:yes gene_type:complete